MDDTELYSTLEIEGENEGELNVDDTDQQRYLDLEFENEIEVIDSGKADVGDGTLTITQGGVTKGTFNANSKTDVTVDVDAPEEAGDGTLTITQGGEVKGTFTANSTGDVAIELDAGGECEVTKAEFDAEVARAKAAEEANADAIAEEIDRATAKEAEIEGMFDDYAEKTHTHVCADVTDLETKLAKYAPLESPALTGAPTAPTAAAGTNTTQIATCEFVANAIPSISFGTYKATTTVTGGKGAYVTVKASDLGLTKITGIVGSLVTQYPDEGCTCELYSNNTTASQAQFRVHNGATQTNTMYIYCLAWGEK